ncbi:MAG: hypothetical protein IIC91_03720 [Chloroflexi bacterium]|nr:hypothetical protein [Chloroflexota bacterium]
MLSAAGLLGAMARGERGQTLAEYSLLLTLIGVGVVVPAMLLFRAALAGAFSDATAWILRTAC